MGVTALIFKKIFMGVTPLIFQVAKVLKTDGINFLEQNL